MSDILTTITAIVGAVTGIASLVWNFLDRRLSYSLVINEVKLEDSEYKKHSIVTIDFDISNKSKKIHNNKRCEI